MPTKTKPRTNRRLKMDARMPGRIAPEATQVDWFDQATPGLALNVSPGGARTWYLFYMKGPTARRVKLGRWPSLTLGLARDAAQKMRREIDTTGADPAHDRQAARTAFTVGDLADLFMQYAQAHKRTWKDDQWRMNRYIRPVWQSRPLTEITRQDVHALLDKIAAAGKPIQANRVQMMLSKMWNIAIDRGHTELNPCHRMMKRAPERTRVTVLDDAALRALWLALEADGGEASSVALRLRLLTGQRGGEVHRMRWTDVHFADRVWTIPAAHAKNGQAQRVPLTDTAVTLLAAQPAGSASPRVFPGLSHQSKPLRALTATISAGAYRWHDLRRTVATRLAALGIREDTISRILNHAKRGITATVYNQHQYDAEKRTALEAWDRELQRIVTEAPRRGADVVPMRRRITVRADVQEVS